MEHQSEEGTFGLRLIQGMKDARDEARLTHPSQMSRAAWVTDARAHHPMLAGILPERCRCGAPAAHKVAEDAQMPNFHPMSAFLCCSCFTLAIGSCHAYPYGG